MGLLCISALLWGYVIKCFYTAKYSRLVCGFFPGIVPRVYTDRGHTPAWFRTPIDPPRPYTYWRFHLDVNAIRQLCGSRGGTWVEVLLCCLDRDNAALSMWVVLTGETVNSREADHHGRGAIGHSHLTQGGKDGAIYDKIPKELSIGFLHL